MEAVEPLGVVRALMEEVCHWGQALRLSSLTGFQFTQLGLKTPCPSSLLLLPCLMLAASSPRPCQDGFFSCKFFIILIYVEVYVSAYGYIFVSSGGHQGQRC